MPYLTYAEYKDFGFTEIEENEFNRLLPKASDAVDSVTRYFYKFNNLDDDVSFRQEQFKKAVACQVEYFHDMGATSTHAIQEAGSVTIGRTTMSQGGRNSTGQQKEQSIVSADVIRYLSPTGLLYRGIGVMS